MPGRKRVHGDFGFFGIPAVAKRTVNGQATYTADSSVDGLTWVRGATWTHTRSNEKIGIAGSNLSGFVANFDYVHVSTLQ